MITEKRELKDVLISKIVPYSKNPRKNWNAIKSVANSLKEFGLVKNSVVVDEDMVLITGHTTIEAMKQLKWLESPAVTQVFGLTQSQKRAYRMADNKLGEAAKWDNLLLVDEFTSLEQEGYDLMHTGFNESEIEKLLGETSNREYSIDDFVFDGPEKPCWFVILADQETQQELEEELIELSKKYKFKMESPDAA